MTIQRVHVIGTGLIGSSLGLALSRRGVHVTLEDISSTNAALARDLGAGALSEPLDTPDVVVAATPPDVTAGIVAGALDRWPSAVVTDVASVKGSIVRALEQRGGGSGDLRRYCGSHPMAGRERSGAIAARADLFEGRPWVVTPTEATAADALATVQELARLVGSAVTVLDPASHDAAVAAVSHVPQVVASLAAARLRDLPEEAVGLAGQGLRDVTRIAASDPGLWTQILAANPRAVRDELKAFSGDLEAVIGALGQLGDGDDAPGARGILATTIANGNAGHARIPGKHGAAPTQYGVVRVLIPDEPGQLGRLFQDVGDTGTNIEEFIIDHGLGGQFGVGEVYVVPAAAEGLAEALQRKGWTLHA
ncbi:prephenate dehydrogenase [Phycicoccus elongatus]|uniref:prephenate dehydrogenase n=1 Tax=Phycicoccus elongatus TaxID=101689 RepID=UPI002CF8AADC|nr:prephenate dehydrogenase [Phycicoccus elongatus]HPQ73596.1 prephenate dehydrogenase [Phycicoccus elongatus]